MGWEILIKKPYHSVRTSPLRGRRNKSQKGPCYHESIRYPRVLLSNPTIVRIYAQRLQDG